MPDAPHTAPDPLARFDRGPSAGDFAYDAIRAAILSLALPPGTVISRSDLATRLGLSQTPVREALIRLQTEDLVRVVPNASTRIAPISLEAAREANFLRLALEAEAIRRVAGSTRGEAPQAMRAAFARQQERHRAGDPAGFTAEDDAFHAALYEAAGVPGLWALVRSRSGHLDRLRRLDLPTPGKAEAILAEHARILAALEAGDAAGAEAALRTHLSGTVARMEAIRAEHPAFF